MTTNIAWVNVPGKDGLPARQPMTWNPITGCKACSPGCLNCYAATMAATRLKERERYVGLATKVDGRFAYTGEVRCHEELLDVPLRWRKPRSIFVCSMSDLFHPEVPNTFIAQVFFTMTACPQHVFQLLTKRPERMAAVATSGWFAKALTNLWLGTTVENQAMADERIPELFKCPAPVRFVSCEPLLGPLKLRLRLDLIKGHIPLDQCGLDWVIVGAETGPHARPMEIDWALDIQAQCKAAGVPFFFKQGGRGQKIPKGLNVREWPEVKEPK